MDSFNLDRLSTIIKELEDQRDRCGDTDELEKRIEALSATAISINELFSEIKAMMPQEEVASLGIDDGLAEINALLEKTKIEFDSLSVLQEEFNKKGQNGFSNQT